MNTKIAVGTIVILIMLLVLFYNPVIFPLVNFTISVFHQNTKGLIEQNLTWNPYPYTTLILSSIVNWSIYLFTHRLPLAILIFISILMLLLEIRWWRSG